MIDNMWLTLIVRQFPLATMPKSTLFIGISLITVSVSKCVHTALTYMGSINKRPDITGNPYQVFMFENLLDQLIGDIKGNTIAAIGTINPGYLCIQYL